MKASRGVGAEEGCRGRRGCVRTSAFASEATPRAARPTLVAAARRVDASLAAAVVENLSAVRRVSADPPPARVLRRRLPRPSGTTPPRRRPFAGSRRRRRKPRAARLRRQLAELDRGTPSATSIASPSPSCGSASAGPPATKVRPPPSRAAASVRSSFARAASPRRHPPRQRGRARRPPPGHARQTPARTRRRRRRVRRGWRAARVGVRFRRRRGRRAQDRRRVAASSSARGAFVTGDARTDRRDRATPRARAAIHGPRGAHDRPPSSRRGRRRDLQRAVVARSRARVRSHSRRRRKRRGGARTTPSPRLSSRRDDPSRRRSRGTPRTGRPWKTCPRAFATATSSCIVGVASSAPESPCGEEQRERDATLAAPKEGHARSFAVVANTAARW